RFALKGRLIFGPDARLLSLSSVLRQEILALFPELNDDWDATT
ncbi:hypothetical protein Tco_1490482, partial [Tanacetum coccineum]